MTDTAFSTVTDLIDGFASGALSPVAVMDRYLNKLPPMTISYMHLSPFMRTMRVWRPRRRRRRRDRGTGLVRFMAFRLL